MVAGGRGSGMLISELPLFSYDVAVIDPPWAWKAYSDKGLAKSPEAQYRTMSLDDISALRIGDLLAPAGVLICWGTWPLLEKQYQVIRNWGLNPVTGGVWAKRTINFKLRWGPGYVLRSVCEPFVVATLRGAVVKGSSVANLIETIEDGVVDGLAREHSRKPDEFYSMVDTLVPVGRRADIFARSQRAGWDCAGNEVDKFDVVEAAI